MFDYFFKNCLVISIGNIAISGPSGRAGLRRKSAAGRTVNKLLWLCAIDGPIPPW